MAFAYTVTAEALRNEAVRTYFATLETLPTPEHILKHVRPSLKVLWRPGLEDISITLKSIDIPDPDPALVLIYNNDMYVVSTWEDAKEEPLDHLLKEYTMGRIQPGLFE